MSLRPKIGLPITGYQNNEITYPAIFLRKVFARNEPFEFGGTDNTKITATAVVFADSSFLLDAVTSIFEDTVRTHIPLVSEDEMPYNIYGGFKTGGFNYSATTNDKTVNNSGVFIADVNVAKFSQRFYSDIKHLNPNAYYALIDFKLEKPRLVRS